MSGGRNKIQTVNQGTYNNGYDQKRRDKKRINDVSTEQRITEYRIRWPKHLLRISPGRITKLSSFVKFINKFINHLYTPEGRKDLSRPRKRWESEAETENIPSP